MTRTLPYPCLDDETQPCREFCGKYMRKECDGKEYMMAAGGKSYARNQILLRKRIDENKGKRMHPEILLSFIHGATLPDTVRIVSAEEFNKRKKS